MFYYSPEQNLRATCAVVATRSLSSILLRICLNLRLATLCPFLGERQPRHALFAYLVSIDSNIHICMYVVIYTTDKQYNSSFYIMPRHFIECLGILCNNTRSEESRERRGLPEFPNKSSL